MLQHCARYGQGQEPLQGTQEEAEFEAGTGHTVIPDVGRRLQEAGALLSAGTEVHMIDL